jgi:quinol monooxygenase YgiN
MLRRALWVPAVWALLAAPAAAQQQNDLLDVFTVQVKPEKMAQFEAVSKKIVAANRQNKGSDWLAVSQEYGPGHTIRFISTRPNFAAIETANAAFMGAMIKAYGQAGTEQIFRDGDACMESARSEVRRRRSELSSNAPADPAAMSRLVGDARWLQTTIVRVRPGMGLKVEEQIRALKAANERANPKITMLVSQAVTGQTGTVYYITSFRKSLAEIDGAPPMAQLLGEDAYGAFLKAASETVVTTEYIIGRFRPELSNPPDEVAAIAPDFWRPKPPPASKGAKEGGAKAAAPKPQ